MPMMFRPVLRPAFALLGLLLAPILTTHATPPEPCRFVQLCDTQLGMGGYESDKARFRAAVEAINALKVDWVVICGDLVNNGRDDSAVADFQSIVKGFTMPCYLAPGNHDVENEPTVASLARYRKLQGKDYYAVEQAGFSILVLNTQLWKAPVAGETETFDAWYGESLRAAKGADMPVLLVSHYPPFLADIEEEEGYYNLPKATRERVLQLAADHGVRAWLAGHVHKNIETAHGDIPIVASATTSKNFDGAPYGFRLWTVDATGTLTHAYQPLELPEALITPDK